MTITPAEQVGQAALSGFAQYENEIAELKRQLKEWRDQAHQLLSNYEHSEKQLAESQAREARLREALDEIDNWLVCASIATAEDMAQSFPHMEKVASDSLSIPHDDTALKEYGYSIVEKCAVIAGNSCLVPPDGGSPTVDEAAVSEEAARRIRTMRTA